MLLAPRRTVGRRARRPWPRSLAAVLVCVLAVASCGGARSPFREPPEYEEEIYLSLDGTATVNVNASVASLVALRGCQSGRRSAGARGSCRGAPLLRRPRCAGDERQPGPPRRPALRARRSRRGRRARRSRKLAPFAWSRYRFEPRGDIVEFEQTVGRPSGRAVTGRGLGRQRDGVVPRARAERDRLPQHRRRAARQHSGVGCSRCRRG